MNACWPAVARWSSEAVAASGAKWRGCSRHSAPGVVVNGRDENAVSGTVAEITQAGDAAVGFAGSPADEHTAEALIASCVDEFGRLDILVNCAGIPEPPGSSILTITGDEFRTVLDSHLGTTFHTCRAAAPRMVDQGHGRDRQHQFVRLSR